MFITLLKSKLPNFHKKTGGNYTIDQNFICSSAIFTRNTYYTVVKVIAL